MIPANRTECGDSDQPRQARMIVGIYGATGLARYIHQP